MTCFRVTQALEVFDAMVAAEISPDVITYSALITACEKVGSWETALELFTEMTSSGISPGAFRRCHVVASAVILWFVSV